MGLYLDDGIFAPRWSYAFQLDVPQGLTEDCLVDYLVLKFEISNIQSGGWDVEAEPEEEVEECDQCEGTGYVYDSWTGQRDTCSSCATKNLSDRTTRQD